LNDPVKSSDHLKNIGDENIMTRDGRCGKFDFDVMHDAMRP